MKRARGFLVSSETVSADRARRVSYLSLLPTREFLDAGNIVAEALHGQAA